MREHEVRKCTLHEGENDASTKTPNPKKARLRVEKKNVVDPKNPLP